MNQERTFLFRTSVGVLLAQYVLGSRKLAVCQILHYPSFKISFDRENHVFYTKLIMSMHRGKSPTTSDSVSCADHWR